MSIMMLLCILILAGPEIIFIKQISEYTIHIMLFLFIMGFVFLIFNKPRLMFMSYASCAALCVFIKNESNGDLISPRENKTEKLLVSHINLSNVNDIKNLIKELKRNEPDLISFQEFTPDWQSALDTLKIEYPYSFKAVRIDPFGKAIFSKFPIEIKDTLNQNIAFDLAFVLSKTQYRFNIVSLYLTPSLDKNSLANSKLQMKNISKYVNDQNIKVIVLGEFNTVYWSEEIRAFREATNLNNSRKDVIPANLKIPYDQIFYSKDLQCVNVKDFIINKGERVGLISMFQQNINQNSQKISN